MNVPAAVERPSDERYDADLLIVGTGAAGLAAAIEAGNRGARVVLVTSGELLSGSSPRAQGGVAAALGHDDSVSEHALDTMAVGAGLNDARAVDLLVAEGAQAVHTLVLEGAPFEQGPHGPAMGLEAGHGRRRILHAGGGATGYWLTRFLLDRVHEIQRIRVVEHCSLDRLLQRDGPVTGAVFRHHPALSGKEKPLRASTCDAADEVCDTPEAHLLTVMAPAVILATGGAGALWWLTTNAPETRGVGIGLAYGAGATVMDLEMMQFHPTALVVPGQPAFLLSEALRGEGAMLVDGRERPFVDPLQPRDIVARAVAQQVMAQGAAYLSLRHLDPNVVAERFPSLRREVADRGFDLARDLLPVAPAAHYLMGGIRTDLDGRTDVPGLFAAGECACTGVQGANRLASNSLLECLVFGKRAARAAIEGRAATAARWNPAADTRALELDPWEPLTKARDRALAPGEVGDMLDRWVGVVRDDAGLRAAVDRLPRLDAPSTSPDQVVAGLVARSALLRQESRGAHWRRDFPASHRAWHGHVLWQRDRGARFESLENDAARSNHQDLGA